MKGKKKTVVFILIIIIFSIGGYCYYKSCCNYGRDYGDSNVMLTEERELKDDSSSLNKVVNILLLGVDNQENASDTIMILSLNKEKKTAKLASIMRDTYIYQGEGMANKINYAYHYGGVNGSINTVNTIFNLDITKYVKVDFENLVSIVDYLDGVEVDINEKEREYINASCKDNLINNLGNVNLNGKQALAFSRIRKIDSDFERTKRQRKVMEGIFHKINKIDKLKYPKAIYTLAHSSETNLSILELFEIGNLITSFDKNNFNELRIPLDGTTSDSTIGVYHLNWDEEVNKKALHDFIYN